MRNYNLAGSGVAHALLMALSLTCAGVARAHAVWSIDGVEKAALESSPRVRTAQAALQTAMAHRAFGELPVVGNPVINLRAMLGKPDAPAATYAALLGIPFDVSGKRRAWRHETRALIAAAQASLDAVRNQVRAEAREAYVHAALGEAALQVAEENAETAAGILRNVQARFVANGATALDVALAERELGESRADLARARRDLLAARASLRQVLDLPPNEHIAVAELSAPELPEGLSLELAVTASLQRRREVAALAHEVERLTRADSRLRREAVAPLLFALEAEAQGNQNTQSTGGTSMSFSLPVVLKNQGERAVTRGHRRATALDKVLTEHTVAREAASAFLRFQTALEELSALEETATPAANRALAMTHELLEAGAVDYFRLLAARRSAFELRARTVESLREAWLSRVALERAIGGLEETP